MKNLTNKISLQVETLEARTLMASSISLTSQGILDIRGTNADDKIQVREVGHNLYIKDNGSTVGHFKKAAVKSILFVGYAGNDDFRNVSNTAVRALGYDGNDLLYGGTDSDTLIGGNGADRLYGHKGNDRLYGHNDNDLVIGQAGDDYMHGGNGNDRLYAHTGDDVLLGANGNDILYGYQGNDRIYGHAGNDVLNGHAGNDRLYAHAGNDLLIGDSGNDVLVGYQGDDRLYGNDGVDSLYGNDDNDRLYGGNGTDYLYGGNGNDGLFGGGKFDVDYLAGQGGADRFLQDSNLDNVYDLYSNDAVISFTGKAASSVPLNGFGNVEFATGTWTDAEIEKADVALNNLHHLVGSTRLLKTAAGQQITFERVGTQITQLPNGGLIGGWNGGQVIAFTQTAFRSNEALAKTIYHEIAHNWDDPTENTFTTAFRTVSGWTQQPTTEGQWQWDNATGWQWVQVNPFLAANDKNGTWFYRGDSQFARQYGTYNPFEDYATTWEVYFMKRFHANHYNTNMTGYTEVAAKLNNVQQFIDSVRYWG